MFIDDPLCLLTIYIKICCNFSILNESFIMHFIVYVNLTLINSYLVVN